MNSNLHPYIAFAGEPSEGAVLAFASSAREARRVAFDEIRSWTDCTFVDVRARRLRNHPGYYQQLADAARMAAGQAHVIVDPPSCKRCQLWGDPLDAHAICTSCRDAERDDPEARA